MYLVAFCPCRGDGEPAAFGTNDYAKRPDHLLCRRLCEPHEQQRNGQRLDARRRYDADDQRDCEWELYRSIHRWQWLLGDLGAYGRDGESRAIYTCDYPQRPDDLLRWRKRDLDEQQRNGQRLVARWCYDTIDYSHDGGNIYRCCDFCRMYLGPIDSCHGYDHDSGSDAYDHAERSDDFLCGWQCDLDLKCHRQQRMESGWCDDTSHYGDHFWQLYGVGGQW
jgi:hypothetical protein